MSFRLSENSVPPSSSLGDSSRVLLCEEEITFWAACSVLGTESNCYVLLMLTKSWHSGHCSLWFMIHELQSSAKRNVPSRDTQKKTVGFTLKVWELWNSHAFLSVENYLLLSVKGTLSLPLHHSGWNLRKATKLSDARVHAHTHSLTHSHCCDSVFSSSLSSWLTSCLEQDQDPGLIDQKDLLEGFLLFSLLDLFGAHPVPGIELATGVLELNQTVLEFQGFVVGDRGGCWEDFCNAICKQIIEIKSTGPWWKKFTQGCTQWL